MKLYFEKLASVSHFSQDNNPIYYYNSICQTNYWIKYIHKILKYIHILRLVVFFKHISEYCRCFGSKK